LHVRDFGGERLIQALGELGKCEISAACARTELGAALFPVRRLLKKCLPFLAVFLVGAALCLTLTLRDVMFAFRALGPIALFCGAAGIFSETKKILRERAFIKGMDSQRALEHSAWRCFLRDAPKKYRENDITYIPINGETLKLDTEGLALEYCLLPAISRQAFEAIHHKE
ncbi:MAG: hypothetical protein K5841_04330, partial [Fretibacterium sp.]|nr:hypothetical protein [Fretibacterium sp.]